MSDNNILYINDNIDINNDDTNDIDIFKFSSSFDQDISGIDWTRYKSLHTILLGSSFQQSLDKVKWSATSIKTIKFNCVFRHNMDNIIWPIALEEISLVSHRNQLIDNIRWPSTLTQMTLTCYFNQDISQVDWKRYYKLELLRFGYYFYQDVRGITFPEGLTSLIFECNRVYDLNGILYPENLHTLWYSGLITCDLTNVKFPVSLQVLQLCVQRPTNIDWLRYKSLHTLVLYSISDREFYRFNLSSTEIVVDYAKSFINKFRAHKIIVFPTMLKTLNLSCQIDNIIMHSNLNELHELHLTGNLNTPVSDIIWPQSLKTLLLGGKFDQSLEFMRWPPLLDKLILGDYYYSQPLCHWPKSLTYLKINGMFDQKINFVPENLKTLIIHCDFNNDVLNVKWPQSLYSIEVLISFNRSLDSVNWPDSLFIIKLGYQFNQSISHAKFPNNLNTFIIGDNTCSDHYDQSINLTKFPSTLSVLSLGGKFNQPLGRGSLEENLIENLGWSLEESFEESLEGRLEESFRGSFNNLCNIVDITFGKSFNQDIMNVVFNQLYIVRDCSLKITIESCKFPKSLYKIIWYPYETASHAEDYHEIIKYQRKLGQYTKAAFTF
jgi:hypothetical protein